MAAPANLTNVGSFAPIAGFEVIVKTHFCRPVCTLSLSIFRFSILVPFPFAFADIRLMIC